MKKVFITIISFYMASFAYAQTDSESTSSVSTNTINYKQTTGDNSLELALLPFNPNVAFQLPAEFGIRYRKFTSETFAFRMGVDLSFSSSTSISQQANAPALELKDKFSRFGVMLRPGIEKHLFSSERLSPYFGAELIFGWRTTTFINERQNNTVIEESTTKNGYVGDGLTIGMGGLAGVDFYVAKKLYLGLELNYSIRYRSRATEKFTDFDGTETEYKNGSTFSFAPGAFASFRVGYLF